MKPFIFHPAIYEEVQAAYGWYENKASGLGDDLIKELEESYDSRQLMPEA